MPPAWRWMRRGLSLRGASAAQGLDEVGVKDNKAALGTVFLTVFLDLVGFGMIIPLVPLYGREYHAAGWRLGLLGAGFSLMGFFFTPFWGRLSDRVGRRKVMLVSMAGGSASYLLFGLASTWPVLLGSRLLAGFFAGNIAAAQAVVADVTTPENRAKGMGLIGMAFGLGFILGPPLSVLATHLGGLPAPGLAASGLGLANLVLALFILPETLPPESRLAKPRALLSSPLDLASLRQALAKPGLDLLLLLLFGATLAFSNLEQCFSLLFSTRFGGGASQAIARTGWMMAWLGVLTAVVQGGLIHPLTRRFGERRLLGFGLALQAVGIFCMPFMPSYLSYGLLMLPLAAGSGLINPSLSSLLSRSASSKDQGGVLGLGQGLSSLARALGPFIGLAAFEWDLRLPFIIGGSIMLILLLLDMRYKTKS